ncbi:hypothetical protein G7054_g3514 [Neopestalotiopsis clavispora]|nr:hypothetical protein G7054_g3514 [Neopestalotiopsis clavispora]
MPRRFVPTKEERKRADWNRQKGKMKKKKKKNKQGQKQPTLEKREMVVKERGTATLGQSSLSTRFRERLSVIFGRPSLWLSGKNKKGTGRPGDDDASDDKNHNNRVHFSGLFRLTIQGLGRPFMGPLVGLPREEWQCARCRAACNLVPGTGEGLLRWWFWQWLSELGVALTGGWTRDRETTKTTALTNRLASNLIGLQRYIGRVLPKPMRRWLNEYNKKKKERDRREAKMKRSPSARMELD